MTTMPYILGWSIGWGELLAIGVLMVLIFGRRLPDVGRTLGQGLVEFKKGLKGVKDDVSDATQNAKDVAEAAGAAGEKDEKTG